MCFVEFMLAILLVLFGYEQHFQIKKFYFQAFHLNYYYCRSRYISLTYCHLKYHYAPVALARFQSK